MENKIQNAIAKFELQISSVFKIIEFDKEYLEIVVRQLEEHKEKLIRLGITTNPMHHPTAQIEFLKSLIKSGPKQSKYQPVYNQCLVLLVSYFASAVNSILNEGLNHYLNNNDTLPDNIANQEFKLSLRELQDLQFDLSEEIGSVIVRKSDISFQDMKSIKRAFEQFLGITIQKDENVDNIITYPPGELHLDGYRERDYFLNFSFRLCSRQAFQLAGSRSVIC
ncbi:MAG: hypothetical protein CV087_23765 [Candidatus Brocadia sp. WS118]|nr:MAG: hypothetical protein CV087_23765 [Candidatus Brocadia sp. WS118]